MTQDQGISEALRSAIRNILLTDWDPHNAAKLTEASGTYDVYLSPLAEMISRGTNEEALVEWLYAREQESMCFPSLGKQRLRRVASKLQELQNRAEVASLSPD